MIPDKPRRHDGIPPTRRPPEYDRYIGEWIAVLDGKVIAHAARSIDVLRQLEELGEVGDAVVEYVAPPSNSWLVGVG